MEKPGWRILIMMKMERFMSKYTDLLDKIIDLSKEYRHHATFTDLFSKEVCECYHQLADDLEIIVEDEADE